MRYDPSKPPTNPKLSTKFQGVSSAKEGDPKILQTWFVQVIRSYLPQGGLPTIIINGVMGPLFQWRFEMGLPGVITLLIGVISLHLQLDPGPILQLPFGSFPTFENGCQSRAYSAPGMFR